MYKQYLGQVSILVQINCFERVMPLGNVNCIENSCIELTKIQFLTELYETFSIGKHHQYQWTRL